MWIKIIANIVTLGIPAIISAIAEARRKKRNQEARIEALARKFKCDDTPKSGVTRAGIDDNPY